MDYDRQIAKDNFSEPNSLSDLTSSYDQGIEKMFYNIHLNSTLSSLPFCLDSHFSDTSLRIDMSQVKQSQNILLRPGSGHQIFSDFLVL